MEYRVLTNDQKELILQTERNALKHLSEIEAQMLEWKASWREESLDHYLKTRWCMGIFTDDLLKLKAYFLAQPILFFESYTQNLWIEHLYFENLEMAHSLIDLAVKYGKDKHLQRVVFRLNPVFDQIQLPYKFIRKENRVEVLTTKLVI
jgi:hypothetical protein